VGTGFAGIHDVLMDDVTIEGSPAAHITPRNVTVEVQRTENASLMSGAQIFGILAGYGMYVRHVDGLTAAGIDIRFKVKDELPAVVLHDVQHASFSGFRAAVAKGVQCS
jgi:hypothetical protein